MWNLSVNFTGTRTGGDIVSFLFCRCLFCQTPFSWWGNFSVGGGGAVCGSSRFHGAIRYLARGVQRTSRLRSISMSGSFRSIVGQMKERGGIPREHRVCE